MAQARLVFLAEQLEDADALPEIVIRLGRRARPAACTRPRSRRNSPQTLLIPAAGNWPLTAVSRCSASSQPARREQRFDGDQFGLRRHRPTARRRIRRSASAAASARAGVAAAQREPRLERLHRPLVPACSSRRRPRAIAAGSGSLLRGCRAPGGSARACRTRAPVVSRMNCSGLRTSSARLSACSARRRLPSRTLIWPSEASAMPRPCGVPDSSCSSTLRSASAQRLLVPMLHHRDVRLVAADGRDDVAGADHHRQPLGLAQRRHRLVEPSFLRERHAAQRVDEREVAAVAGRVQRRRRLRDVLADDRRVADVAVAEAELVVGEADRARVVRALRLLQRAARAGRCRATVHPWRSPACRAAATARTAAPDAAARALRAAARARRSPAGCRPAGTTLRPARCGSGGSRRGSGPGCLSARTRSAAASAPWPCWSASVALAKISGSATAPQYTGYTARMDRGFTRRAALGQPELSDNGWL